MLTLTERLIMALMLLGLLGSMFWRVNTKLGRSFSDNLKMVPYFVIYALAMALYPYEETTPIPLEESLKILGLFLLGYGALGSFALAGVYWMDVNSSRYEHNRLDTSLIRDEKMVAEAAEWLRKDLRKRRIAATTGAILSLLYVVVQLFA